MPGTPFSLLLFLLTTVIVVGCHTILEAVSENDVGRVRAFVRIFNLKEISDGIAPLILAVRRGNHEMTKILIEAGADVNGKMEGVTSPLMTALKCGNSRVALLLLENGADMEEKNEKNFGKTALAEACAKGCVDVVKYLLDAGADIEAKDNMGCTALFDASFDLTGEAARLLIERGADIEAMSAFYYTSMYASVFSGNMKMFRHLIAAGANIRHRPRSIGRTNTILHCAAICNRYEMVHLILSLGFDVHTKDEYDQTALAIAANFSNIETIQVLLKNGAAAQINDRDIIGLTALHKTVHYQRSFLYANLQRTGTPIPATQFCLHRMVRTIATLVKHGASYNVPEIVLEGVSILQEFLKPERRAEKILLLAYVELRRMVENEKEPLRKFHQRLMSSELSRDPETGENFEAYLRHSLRGKAKTRAQLRDSNPENTVRIYERCQYHTKFYFAKRNYELVNGVTLKRPPYEDIIKEKIFNVYCGENAAVLRKTGLDRLPQDVRRIVLEKVNLHLRKKLKRRSYIVEAIFIMGHAGTEGRILDFNTPDDDLAPFIRDLVNTVQPQLQ